MPTADYYFTVDDEDSTIINTSFKASKNHQPTQGRWPPDSIMETAIRWSPNSSPHEQRFLLVDVVGRSLRYCKVVSRKDKSLDWEEISRNNKVPVFRAFDWSPSNEDVAAVGQWSGETTLVSLSGRSQATSLSIKSQRQCNAVAFNTSSLLATGLERVRNDFCLNIYDINQPAFGLLSPKNGASRSGINPVYKLATSEGITSIKFFKGQPSTLVAGVKGTGVRIYDLRDGADAPSLQLSTTCVHNVAIDPTDENYFVSAGPPKEATVHIWDRRSALHSTAATLGSGPGSVTHDSPVLEFKDIFEGGDRSAPVSLWSLRYCGQESGTLGVLGSSGQFKIIQTKQEYCPEDDSSRSSEDVNDETFDSHMHQLYVHRTYDIDCPSSSVQKPRGVNSSIVSFDFTNLMLSNGQPGAVCLRGNQDISIYDLRGQPRALAVSVRSELAITDYSGRPVRSSDGYWPTPGVVLIQPTESEILNSLDIRGALAINDTPRLRCGAGYLFNCGKNTSIAMHPPLQEMWSWIGRSKAFANNNGMCSENMDFSFLGVHWLWNNGQESLANTRLLSKKSSGCTVSEAITGLAKSLQIPGPTSSQTSKSAHRKLCLRICGLAMDNEELEGTVKGLADAGKQTEAALLALFFDHKRLAFDALRQGSYTEAHKSLSIALMTFATRELDEWWNETIAEMMKDATDPFHHAILTHLFSRDWLDLLDEKTLPLKYRIGIALIRLNDQKLTFYLDTMTENSIQVGSEEGVLLTGLDDRALDLFQSYINRTGDLQTAVLAMSFSAPLYVRSKRFTAWREGYRSQMNSWKMFKQRVAFDIQSTKMAITWEGVKLIQAMPPQVTLRCNNCDNALHRNRSSADPATSSTSKSGFHQGNAFGHFKSATVCPRCGSHLPRCEICDRWIGVPDPHSRGGNSPSLQANLLAEALSICMTCHHTTHYGHAHAWFLNHQVCPAPDCNCRCGELDSAGRK